MVLPETVTRRKAMVTDHMVRGVVGDGEILAGSWGRPNSGGVHVIVPGVRDSETDTSDRTPAHRLQIGSCPPLRWTEDDRIGTSRVTRGKRKTLSF